MKNKKSEEIKEEKKAPKGNKAKKAPARVEDGAVLKNNSSPQKCDGAIVITETEEDIVLDSGFNGDPDGLKNDIKREADKNDVLFRFLVPLFTFLVIGLVAAGLTWYYARPSVTNQKSKEEKIENAPKIKTETTVTPTTTAPPTTTQAPAATPTPTVKTYTVQSGDTLSSIANANGLTSKQLADYNGLTNADSLKIGQVLKVPAQ